MHRRRGTARSVLCVCAMLWWGAQSQAQEAKPPAEASVLERLERLEKQNEQLQKQNEQLQKLLQNLPRAQESPVSSSIDKGEVHQIVSEYLKAQTEQKKAEAGKKKDEWHEVGSDLKLNASWKHGLQFETANSDFKVHVGGRVQYDSVWWSANDTVQFGPGGIGRVDDGVNPRRARITIDGTLYEVFDFLAEYDFTNTFDTLGTGVPRVQNTPVPTDLWGQISHLPVVGHLRIGNHKPWISFEHMISSRFLSFMERSLQFDAFLENGDNGFTPGISIWNTILDERMTWAVGVFKNNRNIFGWNTGDGEYQVAGRLTGLLYYENDGRQLIHVGLGASYRDTDDKESRFRARTEIRNGPAILHNIAAEARFPSTNETLLNPEFVVNAGPFSLQSEYIAVWAANAIFPTAPPAARVNRGTAFYQGAYVELQYFLTGEHHPYNRKAGAYGRIIPHENYFLVSEAGQRLVGLGAWQVLARYSYLDLENQGINGGRVNGATLNDVTLGLNWFLNPNVKIQWNYSMLSRDAIGNGSNGTIYGFGMRLALDF